MFLHLFRPVPVLAALTLALGCSSNCAPLDNGGVLVDVTGIADCSRLEVSATDSGSQYPFTTWPAPESDSGHICSFAGLTGHTGTFSVSVSLDGQGVSTQSVTLEHEDACNISSKLLTFEVTEP